MSIMTTQCSWEDFPFAWKDFKDFRWMAAPWSYLFQGSTMQLDGRCRPSRQAVRPSRQLEEDHANGQLLFTFLLRYNIFLW